MEGYGGIGGDPRPGTRRAEPPPGLVATPPAVSAAEWGQGWRSTSHWFREWELWDLPGAAVTFLVTLVVSATVMVVWAWTTHRAGVSALDVWFGFACTAGAVIGVLMEYRMGGSYRVEQEVVFSSEDAWSVAAASGIAGPVGMVSAMPVALATVLIAKHAKRTRRAFGGTDQPHKALFNAAQTALGVGLAHAVYLMIAQDTAERIMSSRAVVAAAVAAVTIQVVNSVAIAVMIRLVTGGSLPLRTTLRLQFSTVTEDLPLKVLGVLIVCGWQSSPVTILFAIPLVSVMQRAMLHQQLLGQAQTDAKTGLANAEFWRLTAEGFVNRAATDTQDLTVLVVDLDLFKRVNDTYGHLAGDDVLKEVAARLKATVRPGDLVGRFGGEEFVVLLPGAGDSDGTMVAERCRAAIAASPVPSETAGVEIPVTCSIGVSTVTAGTVRALPEVMELADKALYRAKESGRNKVMSGTALQDQP